MNFSTNLVTCIQHLCMLVCEKSMLHILSYCVVSSQPWSLSMCMEYFHESVQVDFFILCLLLFHAFSVWCSNLWYCIAGNFCMVLIFVYLACTFCKNKSYKNLNGQKFCWILTLPHAVKIKHRQLVLYQFPEQPTQRLMISHPIETIKSHKPGKRSPCCAAWAWSDSCSIHVRN